MLLFKYHKLTPAQMETATTLNPEQKMLYETMEAETAEQKLKLVFDPLHPELFVQGEAYLRGKLDVLQEILRPHTETTEEEH